MYIAMDIRKILDLPFFYDLYHDIIGKEKRIFAKEYIRDVQGLRILDIACGTAQILKCIDGYESYLGVDLSQKYLNYARRKYGDHQGVTFLCKNVNDFSERDDQQFDLVLMMGIMMNLDDNEIHHIMTTIKKLIAPGGVFLSYDSVYLDGTKGIAKFLLDYDRGFHLRTEEGYVSLMKKYWEHVEYDLRFDMLRVPYSEILFRCSAD